MEKEFIPYKQALELKELGFDERCFGFYDGVDKSLEHTSCRNSTAVWLFKNSCAAPLYQQAFRWFREKHNIKISIDYKSTDEICYFFRISFQRLANGENPPVMVWHHCDSWLGLNIPLSTYEEAELACLKKLIEIVKNK